MAILLLIFLVLMILYLFKGKNKIREFIYEVIKTKIHGNINEQNKKRIKRGRKKSNTISNKKINPNKTKKLKKHISSKIVKGEHFGIKHSQPPKKSSKHQQKYKLSDDKLMNGKNSDYYLKGQNINNNILFNVQIINTDEKNKKNKNENIFNLKLDKSIKKRKNETNKHLNKINEMSLNSVAKSLNEKGILNEHGNKEDININELNDHEINNLEYPKAVIYDKRTFFEYYLSLIKKKQIILFSFFPNNDYNINYIKISLFIISFSSYFTIIGFFLVTKIYIKFMKIMEHIILNLE